MTDTTADTAYDAAIAYAADLGARHGRNAPDWQYLPGGGRSSATLAETRAWAERTLRGLEDGDPAILDTIPHADLSGEWADTLTGPELYADAMRAADMTHDYPATDAPDWFPDICDAYESAFDTAAEDAIASAARAILS